MMLGPGPGAPILSALLTESRHSDRTLTASVPLPPQIWTAPLSKSLTSPETP